MDRPAVNFYEIGGSSLNPADPDDFNVYNSPDWQPLLALAEEHTDLIRMRSPKLIALPGNRHDEFFQAEQYAENHSRYGRTTLRVGGRTMTDLVRRDRETYTYWVLEHLLKDADDCRAYLELPDEVFAFRPDVSAMLAEEQALGDRGIVMVDTGDPICAAAALFSMEDYTVLAWTEPALFHRLIEKHARYIHQRTEQVAQAFPGRLWRVFGPEYATEPYLSPDLFEQYVVRYTRPMIESIHRTGGFARIHCHGRIRSVLPHIMSMGPAALEPIEPPPQGDVQLEAVRRDYGRDVVLLGNIEAADVQNLPTGQFEQIVRKALRAGTAGEGRGFVLMPSSSPYGRTITARTMANYETMVRLASEWGG